MKNASESNHAAATTNYNESAFYGLKILKNTPETVEVMITLDTAKLIGKVIDSILCNDEYNFSSKRKYYIYNGEKPQGITIGLLLDDAIIQRQDADCCSSMLSSEINILENSNKTGLSINGTINALQEIKKVIRILKERMNMFRNYDTVHTYAISLLSRHGTTSQLCFKMAANKNVFNGNW